jgi:hypothetical protein
VKEFPDVNTAELYDSSSLIKMGAVSRGFGTYYGLLLASIIAPKVTVLPLLDETWWKPIARLAVGGTIMIPGKVFEYIFSGDAEWQ